jgi:hypothetical protein
VKISINNSHNISKNNKSDCFIFYLGFHQTDCFLKDTVSISQEIINNIDNYLNQYLSQTNGKVLIDKRETIEKIILFRLNKRINDSVFSFVFKMLLYMKLFALENCCHENELLLKYILHFGEIPSFNKPLNSKQIFISNNINFIFKLSQQRNITPNCLHISENAINCIPTNIRKYLFTVDNFKNKQIYKLSFKYFTNN